MARRRKPRKNVGRNGKRRTPAQVRAQKKAALASARKRRKNAPQKTTTRVLTGRDSRGRRHKYGTHTFVEKSGPRKYRGVYSNRKSVNRALHAATIAGGILSIGVRYKLASNAKKRRRK